MKTRGIGLDAFLLAGKKARFNSCTLIQERIN